MQKIIDYKAFNLPKPPEGYDIYLMDLSEIPHEGLNNINPDGKNGPIYFYETKDLKTLAFDEESKQAEWKDVAFYSVHPNRRLVIVTLSNGMQIFTDDDPRAIYGLDKDNTFKRATPSDALKLGLKIPVKNIKTDLKYNAEDFIFPIPFDDLKEAREVQKSFYQIGLITLISYDKDLKQFVLYYDEQFKINQSEELYYTEIINIEDTGVYIEGYDLTVPGSDTFINASGVVLSNTMNVHVPALPEAQEEIRNKLMPSKQVFSPRDYRVVNKLKQDFILGANSQVRAPAKNKWIVESTKELMQGINSGKIKLSDDVVILPKQ